MNVQIQKVHVLKGHGSIQWRHKLFVFNVLIFVVLPLSCRSTIGAWKTEP
jgi:hypothetical protein